MKKNRNYFNGKEMPQFNTQKYLKERRKNEKK